MVRRLLPYLRFYWLRLSTAIICMAGVAAISTGLMWLMKYLLDYALADKDMVALKTGVLLVVTGFSLKSIFWYSHTYLTSYVGQSVARQLRDEVYRHLYTLSMGFFN